LYFTVNKITQSAFYVVEYVDQPIVTMQQMTPAICGDMSLYSSLKLRDDRGDSSQYYRIRKMPDDHCWMIDNLKLGLTGGAILTQSNSNVTTSTPIPPTPPNIVNDASWSWADPSSTDSCASGMMIDPASVVGCDYLYNWYTATAGTGTYSIATGDATGSICPAGWRLPKDDGTDGVSNEFAVLSVKMYDVNATPGGTNALDTQYVKNWLPTGYFSASFSGNFWGVFGSPGLSGVYWSSSASSGDLAWYFGITSALISNNQGLKPNGLSVRCII
jgi:uncharacterized protein (TIGR02145 family)